MTYQQIHNLFNQRYNQTNWKQFLGEAFAKARLLATPEILTGIDSNVASQVQKLGYITLNENGIERQIAVFDVTLEEGIILERNRVGLRNLLRKYWKDIDAAFIAYHKPESGKWRFTYVSELTGYDADGEFIKVKTEPKRYTYVLGEGESTRTAAERFTAIATKGSKATLDDVKEAFSVEKLSKAFFDEYKKHYDIFCEFMVSSPNIRQTIFNGDEKAIRDFNKKLLGRIVFLYFIQKKGWLGVPAADDWGKGDFNFLTQQFENFRNKDLFYQEFLSILFFETLNGKRKDDIFNYDNSKFITHNSSLVKIPYLNGGLFEEDDKNHRNLIFPANLFKSLFDFFNQYNFTIYEDDPNDHTVAVDPEMLGHIFENLLEDNKDKGAFYTPKEIVHYMCQQSLIEYLTTWFENKGYEVMGYFSFDNPNQPKLFPANEGRKGQLVMEADNKSTGQQIDRILIEKLLKKKLDDDDKKLVKKHAAEFHTALDKVKICDPAIGSGAFPMGLLHEIFTAKQTLHTFEHGNTKTFDASAVKLNIIQNSIYGVDIEKGAVDIARLRFWLSLIVDEEKPKALPNLDYKIVVGNSLVSKFGDEIIDIDWNLNETSHGLFGADLAKQKGDLLKKISKEQKEFFNPDSDKKKLATDIRKLKIDLLINQLELMINTKGIETKPTGTNRNLAKQTETYLQTIGWKNTIKDLQKLKIKPEAPLHFFDWKLDFPEVMNEQVTTNVGFDIVIGNPPYVGISKLQDKNILQKANYQTFESTGDVYSLFYELGNILLKTKGCLNYITSRQWINAGYGKSTRKYFADQTNPLLLIDFGKAKIFNTATVFVNILMFEKNKNQHQLKACLFPDDFKVEKTDIGTYFNQKNIHLKNVSETVWKIGEDNIEVINQKIEQKGVKLKDCTDIEFYAGIKTGLNEAFHIDEVTKNELIAKDPKNAEVIKPLLRGKDIKRYGYKFEKIYMLFIPWHFPLQDDSSISNASKIAEEAFIKQYPAIYNHLCKFKNELSARNQTETGIRYEWYAMQRYGADFWQNFEEEKIVWIEISDRANYTYDTEGMYLTNSAYFMSGVGLKYILAVLNSRVSDFYFSQITAKIAGGRMRYTKQYVEQIPIPQITSESQKPFELLVNQILIDKKEGKDTTALEQEIDNLVYKLYELTYDEVKVIDPAFGLSEAEYEAIQLE